MYYAFFCLYNGFIAVVALWHSVISIHFPFYIQDTYNYMRHILVLNDIRFQQYFYHRDHNAYFELFSTPLALS